MVQVVVELILGFFNLFFSKDSKKTSEVSKKPKPVHVPELIDEVVPEDPMCTTDFLEKTVDVIIYSDPKLEELGASEDERLKKTEHFLPTGEYFTGPTTKKWVFLHHTAGWENPYKVIDSWARDSRGAVATEYLIGGQRITDNSDEYDGHLVKAFPEGGWGWHLGIGRRPMHSESVGVELNNFGYLTKGGYHKRVDGVRTWVRKTPGKFYTYVGTEAHPSQVIELEREFRGYKYWHNYSDAQLRKMKRWLKYIALRDNIDIRKGLPELIRERGAFEAFDFCSISYVEANPGLWCHTNVDKGKYDLYPHPELIKILLSL
jgi:hypothetical protein